MNPREEADKRLVPENGSTGTCGMDIRNDIPLLCGKFIAFQPVPQGVAADTEELCGYHLVMVVSGQSHMNQRFLQAVGNLLVDTAILLLADITEYRLQKTAEGREIFIIALTKINIRLSE